MSIVELNPVQYANLEKLVFGTFAPLDRFMDEQEFNNVTDTLTLSNGDFFPFPMSLEVPEETADTVTTDASVPLVFKGHRVGELQPTSVFSIDIDRVANAVFGVSDPEHPGVRRLRAHGPYRIGGDVRLDSRVSFAHSSREMLPDQTRELFSAKGWTSVAGFATRNLPHRGHEYLQRLALESVDGLFIQPTVDTTATGGYTPEALIVGYDALIRRCFGESRAVVSLVSTVSHMAGPREALLQAVIRRNYGCTHFIIGRDHSGVGNYYAPYAAHTLSREYANRLGITIIPMRGPFYCLRCRCVATDRTCTHAEDPEAVLELSGTTMRQLQSSDGLVDDRLLRTEVREAVEGMTLFTEVGDR